jgi:hypothetical protein
MFVDRENEIAAYRKQAELARQLADKATSQPMKDDYRKLVQEWLKLADAVAKSRF